MRLTRDAVVGVAACAFGLAYWLMADAVPTSLLSDQVGAGGVPKVLASALTILGAIQVWRGVRQRVAVAPSEMSAHGRALGLLILSCIYVAVMPHLGFLPTTALLIVAVSVYAGIRVGRGTLIVGAVSGVAFWLVFAKLLGIAMPSGVLAGVLG
jgi:hypothetical protein